MSQPTEDATLTDYTKVKIGDPLGSYVVKRILDAGVDHMVYITEDNQINFSDNLGRFNRPANFVRIYQGVNNAEMLADLVLAKDEKKLIQFKENIAQAFIGVLHQNESIELSEKLLQNVETKIKAEGFERIRLAYLLTAFITTVALLLCIILAWVFAEPVTRFLRTDNAYTILLASLTGGIGAFISSFIRFRKYEGNIFIGTWMHKLDGFFRIFYGVIAGFIAALAVKANVIGGFMSSSATSLIFITTIAGASEFLIPSLVAKMDTTLIEGDKKQVPSVDEGQISNN